MPAAKPFWRPIISAPKNAPILGWWPATGQWGIVEWDHEMGGWVDEYEHTPPPPTYWMPLPDPPPDYAVHFCPRCYPVKSSRVGLEVDPGTHGLCPGCGGPLFGLVGSESEPSSP